jgi:type IV pilus assembly PilN-like protein
MAVAVDLSFLYAKAVRLPPVPASEKRRILGLEPERFFPVRAEELVLALRAEDNLVFAVKAPALEAWIAALETIAPVELIEPAPVSLARALGRVRPGPATILLEQPGAGVGVVRIDAGRVHGVRRIQHDAEELHAAVAAAGADEGRVYLRPLNGNRSWHPAPDAAIAAADELPTIAGVPPAHLAAYGAALGLGHRVEEALLPPELARRTARRRGRAVATSALGCAAGLVFALLSLDDFRSRTLARVDAEIARVRGRAEQVLALERQADALGREAHAVATIEAERIDPAAGLAALTRRLPPSAHVLALRGAGREWQIDGYAREAAPLVPLLEADPRFEGVHFLTATSRSRLNGTVYESFSIALRLVRAP